MPVVVSRRRTCPCPLPPASNPIVCRHALTRTTSALVLRHFSPCGVAPAAADAAKPRRGASTAGIQRRLSRVPAVLAGHTHTHMGYIHTYAGQHSTAQLSSLLTGAVIHPVRMYSNSSAQHRSGASRKRSIAKVIHTYQRGGLAVAPAQPSTSLGWCNHDGDHKTCRPASFAHPFVDPLDSIDCT